MKTKLQNCLLLLFLVAAQLNTAQTPGQIYRAAVPATNPLDPNGDGFATNSGTALNTSSPEASQFELPWVALPQVSAEPVSDIDTGSNCGTSDIVSDPNIGSGSSYLFISDPDNIPNNGDELMFFRMRIGKAGSGAFGYSFLFDTDLKFGFTGPNADPNAVAGNPGFELEVILGSGNNNDILIENVDGTTNGIVTSTFDKSINAQRSYALYTDPGCSANNDPFFLDFFVPLSNLGFTTTSNFRVASSTSSSPSSALGGSASDVAGVNDDNFPVDDDAFIAQINANPVSDVSITKTLNTAGPYVAGQTVNYTINVSNAGPNIANDVVVTDTPTNLNITSVSGGGCTGLPCTISSIASGSNVSITLAATINSIGAFNNTASVTAREADNNTANNTDNTGNGGTATAPTFIQETDGPWDDASNWSSNLVPTENDDVTIDDGVVSYLRADQAANNLTLDPGSTVSIPENFTLNIKGNVTNNGNFTLYEVGAGTLPGDPAGSNGNPNVDGEVLLDGPANQDLIGTGSYYNLRVNNTNGVDVTESTVINGYLIVDQGTFTTNDDTLFPCDFDSATGASPFTRHAVGQIGPVAGTISGNVTVEQCFPGRRAFRLVSASTTGSTIHNEWQENPELVDGGYQHDPRPGYGTHITGVVPDPGSNALGQKALDQTNGLDWQPSGNVSMFSFNPNQSWDNVLDTENTNLNAGDAYMLMIRGSRAVNLESNASATSNTKLESTGTVLTLPGGVSINPGIGNDEFALVGNPYHAVVDLGQVVPGSGYTGFIYVYDPNIGGTANVNATGELGGRGGYVTVNVSTGVPNVVTGFDVNATDASIQLQPNQSFFVQGAPTGTPSALVFQETDKNVRGVQSDVFRPSPQSRIFVSLFDQESLNNQDTPDDGLVIYFSETASNAIDANDAPKFFNQDEVIARNEEGSLVSYENRAMPVEEDVLELYTTQYRTTNYILEIGVENLEGHTAYLLDKYTNTETRLNNDQSNTYSFSVDSSIAESTATDRFEIRFRTTTLGTDEFEVEGISVYPNPVSDILNINLGQNQGRFNSIELFDISGKLMIKKALESQLQQTQLDINRFSSGVYLLKLSSNSELFTGKVIIE